MAEEWTAMLEVKSFPKDMSVLDVDHNEPRKCLVNGLFEESVEVNGRIRTFYTYITKGLVYNQPCVVVAAPDDGNVLDYLGRSHWFDFADRHHVFLHILKSEDGGWNFDGADADYMNRVYVQINGRSGYVAMQDNIYAFGVGRGATVAQQAVMKMSSEWSGLATFGELDDKVTINEPVSAGAQDTGKTELVISASKVPVPVWMAWKSKKGANKAVFSYWMRNNGCADEGFSNQWADEVYFPSNVCRKSQINEENIVQVRVSNGYDGKVEPAFLDAVWDYLSKSCRHRGFGTKQLRLRIDPEAYGFTRHTMELDGWTRLWYEYVPRRVAEGGKRAPLVVCMHGRGGSAESFISLSGMSRVAEERDFIVVFPESCVSQQKPGTLRNLLLWEGSYKGEKTDDVKFILSIIDDVKMRCSIDESRIFACGQSSGGMMTSTLAQKAPDVFAAVAPWSALVSPDEELCLPERIEPTVPFFFLFGEKDWLCADLEHGEMDYHATHDIAAFLKNLIKIYELDETPLKYTCGEISYYVYLNKKKVPMLTVGTVRDMSHANYPGESWASWDQFMAKFSKVEGKLLYMGADAI